MSRSMMRLPGKEELRYKERFQWVKATRRDDTNQSETQMILAMSRSPNSPMMASEWGEEMEESKMSCIQRETG